MNSGLFTFRNTNLITNNLDALLLGFTLYSERKMSGTSISAINFNDERVEIDVTITIDLDTKDVIQQLSILDHKYRDYQYVGQLKKLHHPVINLGPTLYDGLNIMFRGNLLVAHEDDLYLDLGFNHVFHTKGNTERFVDYVDISSQYVECDIIERLFLWYDISEQLKKFDLRNKEQSYIGQIFYKRRACNHN
jgi:hypothetical protein